MQKKKILVSGAILLSQPIPHLRPRPRPPLSRAHRVVTGSPGLGTLLGAVFAADGPVGAVLEGLHALHHSGLVSKLSTGFTARTPLLHQPPATEGSHKHHHTTLRRANPNHIITAQLLLSELTWADCTLGCCSAYGWLWAFCSSRRSFD